MTPEAWAVVVSVIVLLVGVFASGMKISKKVGDVSTAMQKQIEKNSEDIDEQKSQINELSKENEKITIEQVRMQKDIENILSHSQKIDTKLDEILKHIGVISIQIAEIKTAQDIKK